VKHAISVPSVLTGRRVRWTVELSAERQEIPVSIPSIPPLASEPQTPARAESIVMRRGTLAFGLVLAVLAVSVVGALALVRHLGSDQEYEVADPSFASEVPTDRDSPVKPIASAPATTRASATAAPAAPAPAKASPPVAADRATPSVRPIAAKQAAAGAEKTRSGKGAKVVAASVPASPTTVATPVVDTHVPEEAPATAADASAIGISTPPAAPAKVAAVDEVTITGCLEIAKDDDRFRLSDTDGANAPQARSWRSGFLRKRSAPVDLIGSTEALTLSREVGQRVAVRGVLSSRKLKVSSVRVVSPSCN
jgi:pyruvate/2-oxoglutarate dehydrogenase complex dihydrolipoamide acyltransferase (E2) component